MEKYNKEKKTLFAHLHITFFCSFFEKAFLLVYFLVVLVSSSAESVLFSSSIAPACVVMLSSSEGISVDARLFMVQLT